MNMKGRDSNPRAMTATRRAWLGGMLAGAAPVALAGEAAAAPSPLTPLLERNRRLRPDYRGGLSNHVSMGLYSLSALGGTPDELGRFAEAHWSVLEPVPKEPGPHLTRQSWSERLGQRDALNGFRAFFEREVATLGHEGSLRRYLPALLPGISAGGFHALIRTGYGVRFADAHEVSDGLAYWAMAFSPLGALGSPGRTEEPRLLYEQITADPRLAHATLGEGLIYQKQRAASDLPGFDAIVDALHPTDATLGRIAALSVRLYAQTGNFTLLHAVTGAHAYRLLQPFIEPRELGLRFFWQALVAAYVSVGAPALAEPASITVPPWSESAERARASLEEHDLKLVDIAREEERFYADPIYQRAAARRTRLL
jgi:questin oxidase-like protein